MKRVFYFVSFAQLGPPRTSDVFCSSERGFYIRKSYLVDGGGVLGISFTFLISFWILF